MRSWTVFLLLALAGCGSDKTSDNSAAPAAAPSAGPRLGDVDLSQPVRATDPALRWALEIAPGTITLTRFAGRGGEGEVTDFYPVSPVADADKAVWTTKDPQGRQVMVTLTRKACSEDGDADIDRPLTAELRIGGAVLRGCAGQRPADGLDGVPENADDMADNAS